MFVGFLFGYAVKGQPTRSLYQTRAFWSGFAMVFFFSGLAFYSYLSSPDWMFMYFVKASEIPQWIVAVIFTGYFLAFNLGFFMKFEVEKIGTKLVAALMVLFLSLSGLIILPVKDRYLNVGTIEQFVAGKTIPLQQSPVGQLGVWVGLMALLAIGLFLWSRRQVFPAGDDR